MPPTDFDPTTAATSAEEVVLVEEEGSVEIIALVAFGLRIGARSP
jgi:hypothetical protein